MARIHKELKRQLSAAALAERRDPAASSRPLEAVVHFRAPGARPAADPEQVQAMARKVLARVQELTSETPLAYNVFANLQYMVVQASRTFIEELVEQPEIASALANRIEKAPGAEGDSPDPN